MVENLVITKDEVKKSNHGWNIIRDTMVEVSKLETITDEDLRRCVKDFRSACSASHSMYCEKVAAMEPDGNIDEVCKKYCPKQVRAWCVKGGSNFHELVVRAFYNIHHHLEEKKSMDKQKVTWKLKYSVEDLRQEMRALEVLYDAAVEADDYTINR